MAKTIEQWLNEYGESHQNKTNKFVHWLCVPAIMFSLLGLIYCIPFPLERTLLLNWASIFLIFALFFYARISIPICMGFIPIGIIILIGIKMIAYFNLPMVLTFTLIFVIAWIGQFWGHKIEGKKPSFLKDLQFLLIGPAWLLHFVYKKLNIAY
jgi:uncharacterized membrane protein YGL010W